jgi:hypothetical protein
MASSLKDAVLYQSHATTMRSEKSHLDILTPKQTLLFNEWFAANRDRCQDVLSRRKKRAASPSSSENSCLLDVCRKLEEVLKIPKQGADEMAW